LGRPGHAAPTARFQSNHSAIPANPRYAVVGAWVVDPRLARELMQQAGDRIAIPLRVWGIVYKFLGPAMILWIMAASQFS
jgi:hypothetical protein